MKKISTADAPQPAGHYSQAIEHQGLIYISGQLPINPINREKKVGSIEDQTNQVLTNLAAILKASNSNIKRVLKITVYISDISLWDQVNQSYAKFFGEHRPARSIVPTRDLHFGFQIEVDAIAAVNS